MDSHNELQIICKISKYCNLRCRYCYEYTELGNRARMSLREIGQMFETVRRQVDVKRDFDAVVFHWQGGEPMLIKPDIYLAIGELSRNAFAGSVPVIHTLQTNLTVLTPAWLDFLRSGTFFSDISISLDVAGAERVDVSGKPRNTAIMKNMQSLLDNGVDFGAIAVLAHHSVNHVRDIFRFYEGLGIRMRFLPFYASAFKEQIERHGLRAEQIVSALCAVFDEWMASETATEVEPLHTYLQFALAFIQRRTTSTYDMGADESLFVVEPRGDTWGIADMYVPGASYGNIFENSFDQLIESPARHAMMTAAQRRMDTHCGACRYFGACPGYPVALASPMERVLIEESGCMVRGVVDHIVARLTRTSLAERISETHPGCADTSSGLAIEAVQ